MDEFPVKLTNMLKKASTNKKGNNHHFLVVLIKINNSNNKSAFELIRDFLRFNLPLSFFPIVITTPQHIAFKGLLLSERLPHYSNYLKISDKYFSPHFYALQPYNH